MRTVIQRVSHASVTIDSKVESSIGTGLLVLVGIGDDDTREDIDWLVRKIAAMRLFDDSEGVMNLSVTDVDGEVLVVSQFTLMASCRKGNRPSYIKAAAPGFSIPMYEMFCESMSDAIGKPVATGEFGADMKVELLNDGPVTIVLDSKNR